MSHIRSVHMIVATAMTSRFRRWAGYLREFLEAKGYKSTSTRAAILKKLRDGWRPSR